MTTRGNFDFLEERDKAMAHLSRQAEGYVYSDPESCMFKLRLMVETMAKRLVRMHMPEYVSEDLAVMLSSLERVGALTRTRADAMHAIRRDGNAAVHGERTPVPTAIRRLKEAHGVARWFAQAAGDGRKVRTGPFVPPAKPASMSSKARSALDAAEKLEDEIEARRRRTRAALLLYGEHDDVAAESARLRGELEALNHVASAAGEPLVDADSVMLILAMEIEQLLEHPRLGMTSREARREAERQFEAAKGKLDAREAEYAKQRAALVAEVEEG